MKVLVIMGSKSDLGVVEKCLSTLEWFNIEHDVRILSAHRALDEVYKVSSEAEGKGYSVIIGAAGKAAHLPGVIAAATVLPVIGLPIGTTALAGADSLYSIVQMPKGVPVATVAIDGAENAAILAAQIISLKSPELRARIKEHKSDIRAVVLRTDSEYNAARNK